VRTVTVVAISTAALLLSAWSGRAPALTPPTCSAEDTRRGATLNSASGEAGGPLYIRFCGRGRLLIRVNGRSWVIRGGNCTQARGVPPTRSVDFGLITNKPAPPGRGVMLWWVLPPNRSQPVPAQEWAVQLPGFSFHTASGRPTVIAKGPKAGTFSLRDDATQLRVTGRWTCARLRVTG
jgi:hypothetical protein